MGNGQDQDRLVEDRWIIRQSLAELSGMMGHHSLTEADPETVRNSDDVFGAFEWDEKPTYEAPAPEPRRPATMADLQMPPDDMDFLAAPKFANLDEFLADFDDPTTASNEEGPAGPPEGEAGDGEVGGFFSDFKWE